MYVGYARVSTTDQNLDGQMDMLKKAGCEEIFVDKASGVKKNRPALSDALKYMRPDDTLVVCRLDRLGRSVRQLIDFINDLKKREIGFRSGRNPIISEIKITPQCYENNSESKN